MQCKVKHFSLNANGEILDPSGNLAVDLPPVDQKFILLVDAIDINERASGSEYNEQWYQVRILSTNGLILADVPIKYDFTQVGFWVWSNAKTDILNQLHLEEVE